MTEVVRLSRGVALPPKAVSEAEEAFARAWGDRPVVREHRFHATRKWRLDFAWPQFKIALEVEGWGRHQNRKGYERDCEKYSEAAILGWRILRVVAWEMHRATDWCLLVDRALEEHATKNS